MSIETRVRSNTPTGGSGGGGSSNSGGLATTGAFYLLGSANTTLPNSLVALAGANVSFSVSGSNLTISSNTGGASNSAGLLGTGGYFILGSGNSTMPNSRVITAGSSITTRTDATNFYIDAVTSLFAGSGGLAGTGFFYAFHTSGSSLYPNSRVITAGSSVTVTTDASNIYITAITPGAAASSAGLAGTGFFYVFHTSGTGLYPNSRLLTAGSSVTITTDSTAVYITAITNSGSGSTTPGTYQLKPQQAKLYSSTSASRIDAGTPFFRLLYSATTQQFSVWSLIVPADYSSNPYVRIYYGADSSIASARSISWIIDQWGIAPNQGRASGYYADTFGGTNTVSIALSAGYSSGTIQMLTVPLATTVSFAASRLINLRISGSGGAMGNVEQINSTLEYTKA